MGNAKWGVVVAAVAIVMVIVVVLVSRGMFTDGEPTDPPPVGGGGSPAESARDQDSGVLADEHMQREATVSGDAVDAIPVAAPGDDPDTGAADRESANAVTATTPDDDPDTGSADREDADTVTVATPGDDPDTGAADREGANTVTATTPGDPPDAGAGSNGSGTAVDTPESVELAESGQAPDDALQAEAETYVRALAEASGDPVPADGVEGFMGPGRTLSSILPGSETTETAPRDSGTADEPGEEPAAGPDATAESVAPAAQPENSRSATAGVPRPEGSDAEGADTVQPQSSSAEAGDTPVSDAPETAVGEAHQARVDLPLSEEAPVTIAELLGAEDAIASDAVFYVHTVRPDDDLGIWGIVHDGITENFAEGVAVHRGESVETYRVDIPSDADQLDADRSSSFLGKIIYDKSQMTYVYNYRTDRLGRNPDMIMPGQEIVIVSFTPRELIEIYKHFARDR